MTKDKLRQLAINEQIRMGKDDMSYGEIACRTEWLYKEAKKAGLVREFKENGII